MISASVFGFMSLTLPGRERLHLQRGLDAAHRHRHQRHAVRLGQALDHAERRGRELGQRRHRAGGHLERKGVGRGQRPARGVLELRGQLDGELASARQRAARSAPTRPPRPRPRSRCSSNAGAMLLPPPLSTICAASLRVTGALNCQRHRPQRQAGGLRVLALAAEGHREGLAHLEVEAPLHVVDHARRRGHALAVDDLHAAGRRQRAVALQRDEAQRLLRGRLVARRRP